jgi:hypothetical protein
MKKIVAITLAVVLVAGMIGGGFAIASNSQPASKATAAVGYINVIKAESYPETTIMAQEIKIPGNEKDLLVDVSLETGLYTDTVVRSKNAEKYTTEAEARIEVMVQATPIDNEGNPTGDPIIAHPNLIVDWEEVGGEQVPIYNGGWVTYDYRMQALSATLQGVITEITCELVYDEVTGEIIGVNCWIDPEDLDPEEIELLLETMAAHSFNFVLMNLPVDTYLVEVKARVASDTTIPMDGDEEMGEAEANATIGLGSVTIEAVRMIHGEVIEVVEPPTP